MVYRVSFFVELAVEVLYIFWLIFYFQIVFANVDAIAGWTYEEVLFLLGLNIVLFEFFVAVVYVWGIRVLPEKIKDGAIDTLLTKPLNTLFNLSLSRPYLASFVSMIPGFYLMGYAWLNLDFELNILNLLLSLVVLLAGMVISYCLMIIVTSLSFIFTNATFLPDIAIDLLEFGQNPHPVYQAPILRLVFYFFLPVVFIASVPIDTFFYGPTWHLIVLVVLLAIVFFYVMIKLWRGLIQRYSSASS